MIYELAVLEWVSESESISFMTKPIFIRWPILVTSLRYMIERWISEIILKSLLYIIILLRQKKLILVRTLI